MLAEKSSRIGIPADLHTPQLQPAPVRIQLCGPDKAEMDTQGAMHSGAVNTQKYTVSDAGPTRTLGATIETGLVGGNCAKSLKNSLDFGLCSAAEDSDFSVLFRDESCGSGKCARAGPAVCWPRPELFR